MFAVILSGGKQYRIKVGDTLYLDTLPIAVGNGMTFDQVLMIGKGEDVCIGQPYVHQGIVSATVLAHGRHPKIHIIKFKRRKHHMKRQGHRQNYTAIKITQIQIPTE